MSNWLTLNDKNVGQHLNRMVMPIEHAEFSKLSYNIPISPESFQCLSPEADVFQDGQAGFVKRFTERLFIIL